MIRELPIDHIHGRADARAIDEATVGGLADSIGAVGLINPIRVRADGDQWEVIAGMHRLAACKRLGLVEITADIIESDDLHAELAMIDENLCRAELSPSDRAKQTFRRQEIYEEIHGKAKAKGAHAANEAMGREHDATAKLADAFTTDTAKATGASERAVRRDAERGEKVIDEVVDLIRGTRLDTGTYLDKLKRLTPNDQVAAAKRDLARLRQDEREAAQRRASNKVQADVKSRAANEVAEMIAEHVPGEWWDAIKSNLYAAGAKNVADALTNITGQSIMDGRFK